MPDLEKDYTRAIGAGQFLFFYAPHDVAPFEFIRPEPPYFGGYHQGTE